MLRRLALIAAGFALPALFAGSPAEAQPKRTDHASVELLAEHAAVVPGKPVTLALKLVPDRNWHTYWLNPGDSGLGTEIDWTLPAGFTPGAIQWPAPHRIEVGPLVNFGYGEEHLLLVDVAVPVDATAGSTVAIKANARWLICSDICVPEEADLALSLPVDAGAAGPADPAIVAARAALPKPVEGASIRVTGDKVALSIPAASLGDTKDALFFPEDASLIDHAEKQRATVEDGVLTVTMTRSNLLLAEPKPISGVLEVAGKGYAVANAPITAYAALSAQGAAPVLAAPPAEDIGLLQAVLVAILGGIILNVMPCVFPILSLKVMGLVEQRGSARRAQIAQGLSYTAGILVSFAVLAAILLAARAGGDQIGWGFHLQSPVAVLILAYLMVAMGLSLAGLFHIGGRLVGVGSNLASRGGLVGSFFTGALATVVATPCTAPFMGAAVGYALTAPAIVALAVFLALGLGLALPYLLVSLIPAIGRALPRPGAWMDRVKQVLAFPLFASAAWLLWVARFQLGAEGLFAALLGVVAIGFAGWALGQAAQVGTRGRLVAQASALAGIIAAGIAIGMADRDRAVAEPIAAATADGVTIEPYSAQRLAELRASGKPVFVNFTAAWCITCLVNERVALNSAPVKAAFAKSGVVILKGDWTNQNPDISRTLEGFGRNGVPLYLLYGPGGVGSPAILPQLLTQAIVLEEIAKL